MTLREENFEWQRLNLKYDEDSFIPLNLSLEDKIKHKKLSDRDWPYDDTCIFCGKTIEEAGGKKLTSSHFIKMFTSDRYIGGGDPEYPYKSVILDDKHYLVFKGKKTLWDRANVNKATIYFKQGFNVWWCQSKSCGDRVCSVCGSATQRAYGCDLIGGVHVPVLPVPAGCVNTECNMYLN